MRLFLILPGFLLCCCKLQAQKAKLLPTRLPDFSITYRVDGGMSYQSEHLFISKDSSYYEKNVGGKRTKKKFTMSNAEMDALYNMLRENKFDEIETTTKKVYDRGGISVSASWGGSPRKYIEVSNAVRSFVNDNWHKEWDAVVSSLQDIIKRKAK